MIIKSYQEMKNFSVMTVIKHKNYILPMALKELKYDQNNFPNALKKSHKAPVTTKRTSSFWMFISFVAISLKVA